MRQVLLRIPDELHARLIHQAEVEGRSLNTLAKELLDAALPDPENESPRERVRRIAREMGSLREYPVPAGPRSTKERLLITGTGPVLDELLDHERR